MAVRTEHPGCARESRKPRGRLTRADTSSEEDMGPDFHPNEAPGLIVRRSCQSFSSAIAAAQMALEQAAVPLIARIEHSRSATEAGLSLRPTTLLLFGSPRGGTPLMQVLPTSAIDLPMKLLVWQDRDDRVWLACDDPGWIAERHGGDPLARRLTVPLSRLVERIMTAAA
jgi:uncharacterized protein (DUF302 family)